MLLTANPPHHHHQRRQHPAAQDFASPSLADDSLPTASASQSYPSTTAPESLSIAAFDRLPIEIDAGFAYSHAAQLYVGQSVYMQNNFSNNPPIRVENTTPRSDTTLYSPQRQSTDNGSVAQNNWHQYGQNQHLAPHLPAQQQQQRFRYPQVAGHKRNNSGSTVASTGPSSPFTPTTSTSYNPHIVDSDSQHCPLFGDSYDLSQAYPQYSKPASSTTFSDTFPLDYSNYSPSQHAHLQSQYQLAVRQMATSQGSGMGNACLPRNSSSDISEDFKTPMDPRNSLPKLDRTMSDIYQDELYNTAPSAIPPTQHAPPNQNNSLLSPKRDVFSERLQAANNGHMSARSNSPANTLSRERSPFQPTSEFAHDGIPHNASVSPAARLNSAAQIRERQKLESDRRAYAQHMGDKKDLQDSTTISPKDALLDVPNDDDEAMPSLFPSEEDSENTMRDRAFHQAVKQESSDTSALSHATRESSSAQSASSAHRTPQLTQQYPFISQPRRQNSSMQSNPEAVPEFPAHLTSMDSTKSETPSSQYSDDASEIRRPFSTSSDAGTYTCTYHGCTMRFETPAKLQRHKRDGHRQGTPPSGSGDDEMANRNSQAGPHKCDRINPSTGKPCSSIFSRPYDLTRHEDTIHNARKQKVKCQFCTEDKTFSRNDALTRHMRVVHPEVDFPGKMKRKGGM